MNRLHPVSAIGTPWHQMCRDDHIDIPGLGLRRVATRPAGATFGPAAVIRHPAAPGDARGYAFTPGAGGSFYQHRDFALAVGHTRSIDGADEGVGIGANRWLYCDGVSGETWLMRLDATPNGGQVDFEVWMENLYGRFGRQYAITPRLLASMSWTPPLPSWTMGTLPTSAELISQLNLAKTGGQLVHQEMAFSNDGALVYINPISNGGDGPDQRSNAYTPTNGVGTPWSNDLEGVGADHVHAGILRINVAGTSTAAGGGLGITATMVEDMPYEGGQVTTYTFGGGEVAHQAILYRTPYGDITRDFYGNKTTNTVDVTINLFGIERTVSGERAEALGTGHQVTVFAQNAVQLARHIRVNASQTRWQEGWHVQTHTNAPAALDETNFLLSGWVSSGIFYHGLPALRRQVASFDPSQPLNIRVENNVYRQAYSGTVWQAV